MYLVDMIYTPMYDYIYVYLIFYVLDFNTPSFMIRVSHTRIISTLRTYSIFIGLCLSPPLLFLKCNLTNVTNFLNLTNFTNFQLISPIFLSDFRKWNY